jgi:pantetheine-phosphate adenylyltransferase
MNTAKERIIVYPTSANPPTWGHADIMMRASQRFDKLIWAIATNPNKPTLGFTLDEKIKMMKAYVHYYQLDNVEVLPCEGAVVRFAQKQGAQFILRGLRNTTDFQMELELAAGNRGIDKNVETICMFSKPHFATISSSLVRELAMLDEKIEQYVLPSLVPMIKDKLRKK